MTQRSNLRPQDILVIAKLAVMKERAVWTQKQLANDLGLSAAEISFSLQRLVHHQLLREDKRVKQTALIEFLIHGIKYVFPVEFGAKVRGIATATSYGAITKALRTNELGLLVWPDPEGKIRGASVTPLYETVPYAAKLDAPLYELLSLIDVIRLGGSRETNIAAKAIEKIILK